MIIFSESFFVIFAARNKIRYAGNSFEVTLFELTFSFEATIFMKFHVLGAILNEFRVYEIVYILANKCTKGPLKNLIDAILLIV